MREYFIVLIYHDLYNYSPNKGQFVFSSSLLQAELQYKCPFMHVKDQFLEVGFVGHMVCIFAILKDTAPVTTIVVVPVYTSTELC